MAVLTKAIMTSDMFSLFDSTVAGVSGMIWLRARGDPGPRSGHGPQRRAEVQG